MITLKELREILAERIDDSEFEDLERRKKRLADREKSAKERLKSLEKRYKETP